MDERVSETKKKSFPQRRLFLFIPSILVLLLIILMLNTFNLLYRYISSYLAQYIMLAALLFLASFLVLKRAQEGIVWESRKEAAYVPDGQLKRMARRLRLASCGFTFTQDLLRRRLARIFEEEGIRAKEEVIIFLETPLEGKRHRTQGETYMEKFSEALTVLEESV